MVQCLKIVQWSLMKVIEDIREYWHWGKALKSRWDCRYAEVVQVDRCAECNAVLEQYDEDTVSLCIISLATFIHREPALAASLLLDSLYVTARYTLLLS